jgi:broad specificity phosphatase PhoE
MAERHLLFSRFPVIYLDTATLGLTGFISTTMRIYFVRHGESTANQVREFSNTGTKHPLTELGIAQAHALAQSLSGQPIERIYASPILRAIQTAQILAGALNAPLEIDEALREWSVGIYEGSRDPAGWELHRQVQEDWFMRRQYDSKMPGGESFNEIRDRFVPFVEKIIHTQGASEQTLVLVSHGGLYMAMLPVILKNVNFGLATQTGFPFTGYVLAETRPDGLFCVSWCGKNL